MFNTKGFTFIEILVVIAIIGILSFSAYGLFGNNSGNMQKVQLEANKLVTILDTVKNYDLVGRSVKIDDKEENPEKFEIEFKDYNIDKDKILSPNVDANNKGKSEVTTTYSGEIDGETKTGSIKEYSLSEYDIRGIILSTIEDDKKNNAILGSGCLYTGSTLSIVYEKQKISLIGPPKKNLKVIRFLVGYVDHIAIVRLNTLSGVMYQTKYYPASDSKLKNEINSLETCS